MTGPMVVTNWINIQYYASTVAPQIYGSGNKTIQNLTCENGLIEGSSGDLKTGLALQSLHDGNRWVHTPARLSVYIAAETDAIETVIAKHPDVAQLVDNCWLHILQIDLSTGCVFSRGLGGEYSEIEV